MKLAHLHTGESFRELWCMSGDLGNGDLFIDFLNKSKPPALNWHGKLKCLPQSSR